MRKYLIITIAAVMALAVAGCSTGAGLEASAEAYFANFESNPAISWQDFFAKIDAGDDPFILSIRQADVYNQGHIKGAYLAAWGSDLADKVAMLPTDKPVYVYCYSGQTAGQAVALMRMLGIDAYSLQSGLNYGAVRIEGYEKYIETTPNELPDAKAKLNKATLKFVQDYFRSVTDNASYQIKSADAAPLIEAGDLTVMDIRRAEDYAAAHIEGAVNVPFGKDMHKQFEQFKDKKILVACYTGQTAGQTVAIMRALGYDAISLAFGMSENGWTGYVKKTAANRYFADFTGNPAIKWDELFAKIDAGEEPFILSIRSESDYAAGHIEGAYLAPWGPDLGDQIALLPTDKPVYVYCYTGQTAGQAVALMRMLGIDAYSVQSGFNSGAMKIEGYEKYVTTEAATELPDAGAHFDAVLLHAVKSYFKGLADVADTPYANYKIGLADAKAAAEAGEASVIDIRKPEDFAAGHIEGAVNIPFGQGMQESFGDLPEGRLIIACYTGQTAGQTTAVLRMLGYDAVSMHLGMTAGWIAEGYPVVTD
ncbi:MAG: rhodanese-like domain-containing protein [Clostridiales bacterium]|nr:rhodanese-like domain-containing protein [Clostridiales bacterium]